MKQATAVRKFPANRSTTRSPGWPRRVASFRSRGPDFCSERSGLAALSSPAPCCSHHHTLVKLGTLYGATDVPLHVQRKLDCCSKDTRRARRAVARCEGLSTIQKEAALTINVLLEVDADDEEKPSSCLHLCAQYATCRTARFKAVQEIIVCSSGRSNSALSSAVFFMSLRNRLSCSELSDFRNRRTLQGGSLRTT